MGSPRPSDSMRRMAVATRPFGSAVLIGACLALGACTAMEFAGEATGPATARPGERRVTIRARLLSSTGTPHGGFVAVAARPSLRALYLARLDNHGELETTVVVPPDDDEVVVVADSGEMVLNNIDHANPQVRGIETEADSLEWWSPRLRGFPLRNLADVVPRVHEGYSESMWDESGTRVLDLVGAARPVGEDGSVVDFGRLRFPTAHARVELLLDLMGADDSPTTSPVVLTGFAELSHLPGRKSIYRHMALAQRGSTVRILLTRAAVRLLLYHRDGIVFLARRDRPWWPPPPPESAVGGEEKERAPPRLDPAEDPERWITRVTLPAEDLERIERGARSVRMSIRLAEPGQGGRRGDWGVPEEPAYWSLGEPSFWW